MTFTKAQVADSPVSFARPGLALVRRTRRLVSADHTFLLRTRPTALHRLRAGRQIVTLREA
jgi:hypothetical protein